MKTHNSNSNIYFLNVIVNMFERAYNFIINRKIGSFIVDVVETNISTFPSKGHHQGKILYLQM